MHKLLNVATLIFAVFFTAAATVRAEPTSQTNPRLKRALEQFPEADANRDGVLTQSEAQAYLASAPAPDHANLRYGPHERNVLDLWLAKGDSAAGPRPLVVYIHGGGWVGGDKSPPLPPGAVKRFLDAGIHFASINYRYSTTAPFPAPVRDGGLAIQYLRHHAGRYNIDPSRVAAYGGSAGAVTSLWLAFRDDMADPAAADPVLRESTRLTCAGSIVGPTTLDKKTMDEWFGMKVVVHPAMYPFFGLSPGNAEALYSDEVRTVAAEASPIHHLSKDDPPVFLDFPQDLEPLTAKHTAGEMVHHPLFGVKLKEAADQIGVEAIFQARNRPQDKYKDLVEFVIQKLNRPA